MFKSFLLLWLLISSAWIQADEEGFFLRQNLEKAKIGDYVITSQNKNYTVLLIKNRTKEHLNLEEITIPQARLLGKNIEWRNWFEEGAPGNTSQLIYSIHLPTGTVQRIFSVTKQNWISTSESQHFFSTLLSLYFQKIPNEERRKIGPPPLFNSPDKRPLWNPPLIINGQTIPNASFTAWRAQWPKDGSELGGESIEIFLPDEQKNTPTYFPYWLQISGPLGKSKVRIIDAGVGMIKDTTKEHAL